MRARIGQSMPICLAFLAGMLWAIGHSSVAAQSDDAPGPLEADVLHGTMQVAAKANGELVIALDRKVSSYQPEDGVADFAAMFAPLDADDIRDWARQASGPVSRTTIERRENRLRISSPELGVLILAVARDKAGPSADSPGKAKRVFGLGLNQMDVRSRGKGLSEIVKELRDRSVISRGRSELGRNETPGE